jgi:hypothetical protein
MRWWLEIPLGKKIVRPVNVCIFLRSHVGNMIETPLLTDSPR